MAWQVKNTDDFNRSNVELNGNTMSDGSGVWGVAGVNGTYSVTSNQLFSNAGSWANVPAFNTNMSSTQDDQAAQIVATMNASAVSGNGGGGTLVRWTSGGSPGTYYYINYRAGGITLYSASTSFPGTSIATSSTVISAGDVLRLEVIGTTLTWFVNGTQDGTATDSSYATGQAGVWQAFSQTFDSYQDYIPASTTNADFFLLMRP